jgi:uncharacterized OsmC-like protein
MDIETATAVPRSPVSCTVTARDHLIVQDKPPGSGGEDAGMMASELLMASLLSCQLSTFAKIAAKRKVAVSVRSIRSTMHFDEAGDIAKIDLHWTFDGADDTARDTLVRLTDKVCTISRVLSCPVAVTHSD